MVSFSFNISLNTDGENYFQTIMSVLVFSQVRCPHWTVWVISPQKTLGAKMWAVFWNVIIVSSITLDLAYFSHYLICRIYSVSSLWWKLFSDHHVGLGLQSSPLSTLDCMSHITSENIRCKNVSCFLKCHHCLIHHSGSGLFFPLSDMSYLLCVFSVGRWWVGLYHVWSTGITGVFCRAAQVSQCGSLSKGVSNISLWKSNLSESWCLFLLTCFTTGNSTNPQNILTLISEKESSLFSPCQKGTVKVQCVRIGHLLNSFSKQNITEVTANCCWILLLWAC